MMVHHGDPLARNMRVLLNAKKERYEKFSLKDRKRNQTNGRMNKRDWHEMKKLVSDTPRLKRKNK